MEPTARDSYLEAQVLTATPQKLRLMLIDGAIRFARQTLCHWEEARNEEALESLIRCRSIVSELLSSIQVDKGGLTQKVAAVYLFLFRTLTEAQLRRDRSAVEKVIEVLEVERETWRLVCEKVPGTPLPTNAVAVAPTEISAADAATRSSGWNSFGESSQGGFVLDA